MKWGMIDNVNFISIKLIANDRLKESVKISNLHIILLCQSEDFSHSSHISALHINIVSIDRLCRFVKSFSFQVFPLILTFHAAPLCWPELPFLRLFCCQSRNILSSILPPWTRLLESFWVSLDLPLNLKQKM